ncbi:MAG TPA: hypothetical protein VMJ10_27270 [Kofleriaceae bacterium]|nr:hypothetical protein [Kofleriaceae bacterium]
MMKPYPWYYAVNDRPVKVVQLSDGSGDILALEWTTGGFVPHREYWEYLSAHDRKDVDQLTESEFDTRVAALRAQILAKLADSPLTWERTGDGELAYRTTVEGQTMTLRVNDFLDEAMYTLLAEGQEISDFDNWPDAWVRPSIPRADPM